MGILSAIMTVLGILCLGGIPLLCGELSCLRAGPAVSGSGGGIGMAHLLAHSLYSVCGPYDLPASAIGDPPAGWAEHCVAYPQLSAFCAGGSEHDADSV